MNICYWTFIIQTRTCSQVEENIKTAESLLSDLSGFQRFRKDATEFRDEMVNWRQETFDEWSREIQSLIEDTKKPLRYAEQTLIY